MSGKPVGPGVSPRGRFARTTGSGTPAERFSRSSHISRAVSSLDSAAASEFVRREHGDVVAVVDDCADGVAAGWDGDSATEAAAVSTPLETCLDESGVLDALPDVLSGAAAAAGGELQASPVAAPPYVVVTSRGPVLRATLDGGRLVVRFDAFRVTDGGRYERTDTGVTAVVR